MMSLLHIVPFSSTTYTYSVVLFQLFYLRVKSNACRVSKKIQLPSTFSADLYIIIKLNSIIHFVVLTYADIKNKSYKTLNLYKGKNFIQIFH